MLRRSRKIAFQNVGYKICGGEGGFASRPQDFLILLNPLPTQMLKACSKSKFVLSVLEYKCLYKLAPAYLTDELHSTAKSDASAGDWPRAPEHFKKWYGSG